jgi:hypothetical protein
VRSTTSTATDDLHHFHHYCYAERNGNTRACSVGAHAEHESLIMFGFPNTK